MIGQSKAHKRLVEEIKLVGGSDLTVLITGETGVGKELVAQAIHAASSRADKPLISLNCAALPETLVESELFGHVRGAFTGALNERRGKFELANGGTLFLDEVGELSLTVQAKLLRVLQSGQLQRLGSDKEHQVDVRLIAATNRDLAEEVRNGRYRADFYHRLSVYPLQVPALRERGRDVLLLAGFFLEQNRSRMGLGSLRLTTDAQAALLAYSWPGNVPRAGALDRTQRVESPGQLPRAPEDSQPERPGPGLARRDCGGGRRSTGPSPAHGQRRPAPGHRALPAPTHQRLPGTPPAQLGQRRRELGLDRANLGRMAKRLGLK